jgi:hypothetical protein
MAAPTAAGSVWVKRSRAAADPTQVSVPFFADIGDEPAVDRERMQGAGQPEQRSDAERIVAQPGSKEGVVGGVVADGQDRRWREKRCRCAALTTKAGPACGAGQPGVDVVQVVELNLVAQALQVGGYPTSPFGFAAGRCSDLLDGDAEVDDLFG